MNTDRDLASFNGLFALLTGSTCSLDALVRRVEERSIIGDALNHVRVASAMAQELDQTGDSLLSAFIDRARDEGHSWAQIGQALGVSKQAAHERFGGPDLSRFTSGARAAVLLASDEARHLGHRWVGAEHILVGLLEEGSGIASRTLKSLGVSLDALRQLVIEDTTPSAPTKPSEMTPALTPKAMRLLGETAPGAAGALGHNYVGTEHLLLALCTQPGEAVAKVLTTLSISHSATQAKVLELLAEPCQQPE